MVVSMPLEELWTLITAMIRSMALWSKPFWLAWPASLDQIQPDIIFGTKMVQRTKGLQSQTHLPHGFLIEQRLFFFVNDKIQFQVTTSDRRALRWHCCEKTASLGRCLMFFPPSRWNFLFSPGCTWGNSPDVQVSILIWWKSKTCVLFLVNQHGSTTDLPPFSGLRVGGFHSQIFSKRPDLSRDCSLVKFGELAFNMIDPLVAG